VLLLISPCLLHLFPYCIFKNLFSYSAIQPQVCNKLSVQSVQWRRCIAAPLLASPLSYTRPSSAFVPAAVESRRHGVFCIRSVRLAADRCRCGLDRLRFRRSVDNASATTRYWVALATPVAWTDESARRRGRRRTFIKLQSSVDRQTDTASNIGPTLHNSVVGLGQTSHCCTYRYVYPTLVMPPAVCLNY